MKKIQILLLITILTVFFGSNIVKAQSELIYKNGVLEYEKKITPNEVRFLMANDSIALSKYNTGRTLHTTGEIIFYSGIFYMAVWELSALLSGRSRDNYTQLIIGASGSVIGILIGLWGESKIKKSLEIYNTNLNNNVSVCFGLTKNGIGLNVRF